MTVKVHDSGRLATLPLRALGRLHGKSGKGPAGTIYRDWMMTQIIRANENTLTLRWITSAPTEAADPLPGIGRQVPETRGYRRESSFVWGRKIIVLSATC